MPTVQAELDETFGHLMPCRFVIDVYLPEAIMELAPTAYAYSIQLYRLYDSMIVLNASPVVSNTAFLAFTASSLGGSLKLCICISD